MRTDTKPWYKQFWPWFIMVLPFSAVVAGISSVIIAHQGADTVIERADAPPLEK